MKTVTKIPPKRNPLTFAPLEKVEKRRVAAYARVSTDSDEQKTSYDAQVDYYTKYIKELVFKGEMSIDELGTKKGKKTMSTLFKEQLKKKRK